MSFVWTETFNTSASFQYSTTAINVFSGTTGFAKLFSTAVAPDPFITSQVRLQASSVSNFSFVKATTGNDEIRFSVNANGSNFYYSTSTGAWVPSNNTYDNATPSSAIAGAVPSFFSTLGIMGQANLSFNAFFHSAGVTLPELTSVTVTYDCVVDPAASVSTCLVYAYLSNLLGGTVAPTASQPAILWAGSNRGYFYGNKFVEPFATSAAFNSAGYAQVQVNETVTPGKELQFWVTYYELKSLKTVKFYNCLVPNQASIALSALTSIRPNDFG